MFQNSDMNSPPPEYEIFDLYFQSTFA